MRPHGFEPPEGGFTIIEGIWNSGNLPYLVANTYGWTIIKIGGMIFQGARSPLLGDLSMIERSWNYGNMPYLAANTYDLNFIKIESIWVFGGQKPPIRGGGYICPVMPIFELGWAIPVKSHVKIWFGLVEIGGQLIFGGGGGKRGVTYDLRCPFTNLPELFQAKVMCENLVRIAWAFQELSW